MSWNSRRFHINIGDIVKYLIATINYPRKDLQAYQRTDKASQHCRSRAVEQILWGYPCGAVAERLVGAYGYAVLVYHSRHSCEADKAGDKDKLTAIAKEKGYRTVTEFINACIDEKIIRFKK